MRWEMMTVCTFPHTQLLLQKYRQHEKGPIAAMVANH